MGLEIANKILEQLGGNKFAVMTGAKNIAGSKNTLFMDLPRNLSKANHLKVTLNEDDTYTMCFDKFRNFEKKNIKTINGVFCDRLQQIFTEVTGMATSL